MNVGLSRNLLTQESALSARSFAIFAYRVLRIDPCVFTRGGGSGGGGTVEEGEDQEGEDEGGHEDAAAREGGGGAGHWGGADESHFSIMLKLL